MNNMVLSTGKKLAESLGIEGEPNDLIAVLKATAFKTKDAATDAQMTALLIVANQYHLSPWTKEIYAFPDSRNGIVPVVGVDGWSRIINEHPQLDGIDFEQDAESCTCIIYRKDRSRPVKVTEWLTECKRPDSQPWKSHPKRMLRHKALIQCARLAFGFTGIYDQDEAERIIESPVSQVSNKKAHPEAEEVNSSYESQWLDLLEEAAEFGLKQLSDSFNTIPKSNEKSALWAKHGESLKKKAKEVEERIIETEQEQEVEV